MKFNYKITTLGWATCKLETSTQQFSFDASWITHALKDFLAAILALNPDTNPEFYENETECSWYQEPGLIEWEFKISDIKSTEENLFFTVKQYTINQSLFPTVTTVFNDDSKTTTNMEYEIKLIMNSLIIN